MTLLDSGYREQKLTRSKMGQWKRITKTSELWKVVVSHQKAVIDADDLAEGQVRGHGAGRHGQRHPVPALGLVETAALHFEQFARNGARRRLGAERAELQQLHFPPSSVIDVVRIQSPLWGTPATPLDLGLPSTHHGGHDPPGS